MGHFVEGENRFEAQGVVLALGVYFADVELSNSVTEAVKHRRCLAHCGIDLASMADVEAEGGIRHGFEDFSQILCRLPDRLSLVHVLDAKTIAETPPLGR